MCILRRNTEEESCSLSAVGNDVGASVFIAAAPICAAMTICQALLGARALIHCHRNKCWGGGVSWWWGVTNDWLS